MKAYSISLRRRSTNIAFESFSATRTTELPHTDAQTRLYFRSNIFLPAKNRFAATTKKKQLARDLRIAIDFVFVFVLPFKSISKLGDGSTECHWCKTVARDVQKIGDRKKNTQKMLEAWFWCARVSACVWAFVSSTLIASIRQCAASTLLRRSQWNYNSHTSARSICIVLQPATERHGNACQAKMSIVGIVTQRQSYSNGNRMKPNSAISFFFFFVFSFMTADQSAQTYHKYIKFFVEVTINVMPELKLNWNAFINNVQAFRVYDVRTAIHHIFFFAVFRLRCLRLICRIRKSILNRPGIKSEILLIVRFIWSDRFLLQTPNDYNLFLYLASLMNLQWSGSRNAATTTTANVMIIIIYVCLFLYSDFISSGDAPSILILTCAIP